MQHGILLQKPKGMRWALSDRTPDRRITEHKSSPKLYAEITVLVSGEQTRNRSSPE